jgi:hypothetical protein
MTRVEIADVALQGIFRAELAGGREAYHLGQCLRMVVGAWMGSGFATVQNGMEVDRAAEGFPVLTQAHLNDLKVRGRDRLGDERIEKARRELAAEMAAARKESA